MTIRVAQVGTGNAGRLTLRQLIADDRFELVAVSPRPPTRSARTPASSPASTSSPASPPSATWTR